MGQNQGRNDECNKRKREPEIESKMGRGEGPRGKTAKLGERAAISNYSEIETTSLRSLTSVNGILIITPIVLNRSLSCHR